MPLNALVAPLFTPSSTAAHPPQPPSKAIVVHSPHALIGRRHTPSSGVSAHPHEEDTDEEDPEGPCPRHLPQDLEGRALASHGLRPRGVCHQDQHD
ncbi:hypothetical protein LINPERHAP2_LOCUS12501 [Linum perenne]